MNEERPQINDNKPSDSYADMKIAGYNLVGMLVYGLLFIGVMGENGLVAFGLFYLGHALICIIAAIVQRKWIWFLTAVLIVIIGFSTCANMFHLNVQ